MKKIIISKREYKSLESERTQLVESQKLKKMKDDF